MPRRAAKRVTTHKCEYCGVEFTPPKLPNYEHRKHRKTCSEECQHKKAKASLEKTLLEKKSRCTIQVKPALPVQVEPKQPKVVNVYRMVHEKARQFAGLGRRG